MQRNIDGLLESLGAASVRVPDLGGIESGVWARIETQAQNRRAMRTQLAVAALALVVGLAAGREASVAPDASGTVYSESSVLSDDASLALSMKL